MPYKERTWIEGNMKNVSNFLFIFDSNWLESILVLAGVNISSALPCRYHIICGSFLLCIFHSFRSPQQELLLFSSLGFHIQIFLELDRGQYKQHFSLHVPLYLWHFHVLYGNFRLAHQGLFLFSTLGFHIQILSLIWGNTNSTHL